MEETVRQGRKMEALGTLAGGITHDFNNILSVVLGYAQLVLDDLTPGTLPYNNQLEIIQAANRAAELIRHILTFCRKGAQDRKQFHPVPLVKETLKLLRAAIPATVEIRSRLAPDIPLIDADPIQIQQVLVNLCTNASFSMRNAGGTLSVEIDRASVSGPVCEQPDRPESSLPSGPCFRLRIRDTGEGIPDDLLDRIFDPYFTTKSKDEGTGLGLSVVQGIVRQHGGFVAVESELGVGSVFSVYLPEVKKAAAPEKTAVNKIFSGGTESILFVDDEPAILNMAAQTLEKLGYTVTTAKNGFEALTIFRENPKRFDLVVSDITMPKMPGDRLAGEILKIRPDMPLLLATGYSDRIKDASGLATGIRGILEKPLSKRELADTIRRALDGKPAGGRETAWPDSEIPSR
jgi:nitrogen-specific signal transduction histidine kinase/ActR/RegA family two-component response regulator